MGTVRNLKLILLILTFSNSAFAAQPNPINTLSLSGISGASPIPSPISSTVSGAVSVVNAPCTNGPTTGVGLRACTALIPQVTAQINTMMQMYGGCYYQGIDLDTSLSPTVPTCTQNGSTSTCTASTISCAGPNFGLACSLVPNTLNSNTAEVSTNIAGKSCGSPMVATATIASCPQNGASQQQLQFLQNQGLSPSSLDSLNAADAQALLSQAQVGPSPVVSSSTATGKQICISMDASGIGSTGPGSMERAYFKGAYLQALSYYATQVLNQITCSQTISIQTAGACQSFANQLAALGSTTQQTVSTLQSMLGAQANVPDINNAFTASFNQTLTASGIDPGQLRQSAQHLSSARSSLEATFTQLAMCTIFSQAQASYLANAGTPGAQLAILNQMDADLDPSPPAVGPLRQACKSSSSLSALNSCLNNGPGGNASLSYKSQMQQYLTNKFAAIWPTQTVLTPTTCSAGGYNANSN